MSSGRDWTDRTNRMAARAPGLDIFSQALAVPEPSGWQVSAAGLKFLAEIERPAPVPSAEPLMMLLAVTAASTTPLIGVNMRRSRQNAKVRGGLTCFHPRT
jgi:hypothetical protein